MRNRSFMGPSYRQVYFVPMSQPTHGCVYQVMRYRVTFAKRFDSDGEASNIDPTQFLDLPDGIVLDKVLVEGFEPEAKHSQEVLDEDDAFLGRAAAEVWEYEISDGCEAEFVNALTNSGTVMEYDQLDELDIPTV